MKTLRALLLSAIALAVVAWQLWLQGTKLVAGNNTSAFLQMPMAPFAFGMSAMAALSTLLLLGLMLRHARGVAPAQPGG